MYDAEIAAAAVILSSSNGKPAKKVDRTYTVRMEELLQKLGEMGFGGWKVAAVGKGLDDPDAQLEGIEDSTSDLMTLRIYHSHGRRVPKHLTFSMIRQRNQRGVIIGVHVGTLRMTDLRTKQSYYDGAAWGLQHFRAQLAVENYRGKMNISPETVESHLAAAMKELVELGITEPQHLLLPAAGTERIRSLDMVPYLVGKYGDMPVAISMTYTSTDAITLTFFIVSPSGLVNLDFGFLQLTKYGRVGGKQMDIGKLLAGPTKK